ncbi:MAG: cupin domain-containing protein [Sphingobacteriaceae bacterium]|nr:cupin domain-containing protein [Sphingobacteriaceae bacterium]
MYNHILLQNLTGMDYNTLEWQFFREGMSIYPIYQSVHSDASAALLKYEPGASAPNHEHLGYEHIFVLQGSQQDERGIYQAGDLLINHPGSSHSITSPGGCVVLAIWEKPVQFT